MKKIFCKDCGKEIGAGDNLQVFVDGHLKKFPEHKSYEEKESN